MSDPTTPPIPKSLLRLCTSLHAYRPGTIDSVSKLTFESAFKSAGGHHPNTSALLRSLSRSRLDLASSLTQTTSPSSTLENSQRYLPLIRTLLLSCEVQPDTAVLDEKLEFRWRGGLEGDDLGGTLGKVRTSQALMYEVTMTLGSISLSHASLACSASLKGDFSEGVKEFKNAANVMEYLRGTHLPQWVALGASTNPSDLPCECDVGCAKGERRKRRRLLTVICFLHFITRSANEDCLSLRWAQVSGVSSRHTHSRWRLQKP